MRQTKTQTCDPPVCHLIWEQHPHSLPLLILFSLPLLTSSSSHSLFLAAPSRFSSLFSAFSLCILAYPPSHASRSRLHPSSVPSLLHLSAIHRSFFTSHLSSSLPPSSLHPLSPSHRPFSIHSTLALLFSAAFPGYATHPVPKDLQTAAALQLCRYPLFFGALLLFEELGLGLADKGNHFGKTVAEFDKILLVEENLVAVEDHRPVGIALLAALGDGQEIIVTACGTHIKK